MGNFRDSKQLVIMPFYPLEKRKRNRIESIPLSLFILSYSQVFFYLFMLHVEARFHPEPLLQQVHVTHWAETGRTLCVLGVAEDLNIRANDW